MAVDSGYRRFFDSVISGTSSPNTIHSFVLSDYSEGEVAETAALTRDHVRSFRKKIARNVVSYCREHPKNKAYIRKALRIPTAIPIGLNWWLKLPMIPIWIVFTLLPRPMYFVLCSKVLHWIGTYEGRRYVFDKLLDYNFPIGHTQYSRVHDYLYRHFTCNISDEKWKQVEVIQLDYLKSGRLIGIESVDDAIELLIPAARKISAELLHLLIINKVITHITHLDWLNYRDRIYTAGAAENLNDIESAVQLLKLHKVENKKITETALKIRGYRVENLKESLSVLEELGIRDIPSMLELFGTRLWSISKIQWKFVINECGAQFPEQIALFNDFLCNGNTLPLEHVRLLKQWGASIVQLAGLQKTLLKVIAMEEKRPTSNMEVLRSEPFQISISQLNGCLNYLKYQSPDFLLEYLNALGDFGFSDTKGILDFANCYPNVSPGALRSYLSLAGTQPSEELSQWVMEANKCMHMGSLEFLISQFTLTSIPQLTQALRISDVSSEILRFVVLDRHIDSFNQLKKWYQNALAVKDYRGGILVDDAEKCLMLDAFQRNDFASLKGNSECLGRIIRTRITTLIGLYPIKGEDIDREAYREAESQLKRQLRLSILSALKVVLHENLGVIHEFIFAGDWSDLDGIIQRLVEFKPQLTELIVGRGPTHPELTAMEIEAVEFVYGISDHRVIPNHWRWVCEYESDWAEYNLEEQYPIVWERSTRLLSATPDKNGLNAIAEAAIFAQDFLKQLSDNFPKAVNRLNARQLTENSADVTTLRFHLGVLLAATFKSSTLRAWFSETLLELPNEDLEAVEASRMFIILKDLFNIELRDALDSALPEFVSEFTNQEAKALACKLGLQARDDMPSVLPQDFLLLALNKTYDKVRDVYSRWCDIQNNCYVVSGSGNMNRSLHACVTKYPAAFFAKFTTALCTRDNRDMWYEKRLSHLVVFDDVTKRFAAFAMVYIELVPKLHTQRPTLIIRAMNPTVSMLASHTTNSIADEFIRVAIEIAKENHLAGVALPANSGADYISNRDLVGRYVMENYISSDSVNRYGRTKSIDANFSCYEIGHGTVNQLFVIWQNNELIDQQKESPYGFADVD